MGFIASSSSETGPTAVIPRISRASRNMGRKNSAFVANICDCSDRFQIFLVCRHPNTNMGRLNDQRINICKCASEGACQSVFVNVYNPLVRRFRNFTSLSADDEDRLNALTAYPQTKAARRDLIREGDRPHSVYLILQGWACRYKMLADGRRQLLQFLLPGDLCDIHNIVLEEMDHSIGAVTELRYTEITHDRIDDIAQNAPHLRSALWWHSMTALAMQREWTLSIGQRCASERLGHLFCELFLRLRAVDLSDGSSCDMPVTQTDLGDATGLTPVHINRTLQQLRENGLIVLKNKRLTIPDLDALQNNALFSENYLHLGRRENNRPLTRIGRPWIP